MRLSVVLGVIGQLLQLFSLSLVLPMGLALWDGTPRDAGRFGVSLVLGVLLGSSMSWGFTPPRVFFRSEALAVVSGTWLGAGVVAALPYVLYGLGPFDAIFESISGLTTTGATILTDFSQYDRAFFFWRAITQWFGGLGVIALFIVVLPRLGIAGRQLFFAEACDAPGEAISPQVRQAASKLWVLYIIYTLVCIGMLMLTGMDWYEATCHAFTALPAGGFSPNGSSLLGYNNAAAEWVLVVFMLLAGASYPLQFKGWTGDWRAVAKDEELFFYLFFAVFGALGAAVAVAGGLPNLDTLRAGFFQSASLISSTGYASVDYNTWPDSARAMLLLVMVVGGCAGSAAGGPKSVRHWLVVKHVWREVKQTLHPRAVLPLRYKGKPVPPDAMRAVFALVVLYVGLSFVVGLVLTIFECDAITGFSAALACVGNIGPGFEIVGPMGNFAGFSWWAKLMLTVAMWLGRLEIMAVLALLHPEVWRNLRWAKRTGAH